jgi:hypothetical protein
VTPWRRLTTLLAALTLMLGVAACGDEAGSAAPGDRGESPSAVGEPGEDASETGGGGAPAEGVEDQNDEN